MIVIGDAGQIITMATEMTDVKPYIKHVQTACERLCRMHLANTQVIEKVKKVPTKKKLKPAGQS